MAKRLYIETVGCQMNVPDSELVVGTLPRQGYDPTHEAADADVIFFDTCSVSQTADGGLRGAAAAWGKSNGTTEAEWFGCATPDELILTCCCVVYND
jgi:tRNA A37 methylthiotransferase MiaB